MRVRKKKDSVTADFEQFLKNNNCQYDIEHEDNATIYNFEFQAARFVAAIRKQDDCVEVTYPNMSSFHVSQLDLVRAKCNERNNSNILFKYSYSIDHESNKVDVHMSFFNNKVDSDNLVHELKAAFHFCQGQRHAGPGERTLQAPARDVLAASSGDEAPA